jgi:large subunit ribosomal protein L30
MFAAILIRGDIGVEQGVRDTLFMLKLRNKHAAILVDETNPVALGMLEKSKDRITFGPVSPEVAAKLEGIMKNGVAHLHPPRGGFERKGIKQPYTNGGVLGKRDSMDKIVEKMLP